MTEGGQWVAVRNGFLLPKRVGMAVFRGKLVAAIRQELARGRLTVPSAQRRQQVDNLLHKLGRATWHVHSRERYPHGQGVLITWPALFAAGHCRIGGCAPARASR